MAKWRSRLIAVRNNHIPKQGQKPQLLRYDTLSEGQIIIPEVALDIENPIWEDAESHILIVRLSPWTDVEQSTSHLVLFSETRSQLLRAYIDFAFLPAAPDRHALNQADLPWFFGRQSHRSPADFDLIMISNAFGLELVNLSYLFSTSSLDWSSRNRANEDGLPIIIIGGSNANCMGAIVKFSADRNTHKTPGKGLEQAEDSFVDGIFFGEGEGAVGPLAAILTRHSSNARVDLSAKARKERLLEARKVQGFWPCLLADEAKKAVATRRPSTPQIPLVLNGNAALEVKLAITAGCPGYCSFCLEGWDRRPYQEGSLEQILAEARALRAKTGADTLEVYSYNFNTHARIFDLLFELNRIFPHVSFMSQRIDILAQTRGLFEAELAAGKRSFTFGIEGVSARMRSFYHKGISDQDIETCLDKALINNVRELKLFFIIAGIEDAQDLEEFSAFVRHIAEKKRATMSSTRVLVSAGFLVRLPFTPLQYAPLGFDRDKLSGLDSALATACEASGVEYRTATSLEEYFVDQTISLAGANLLPWLVTTPTKGIIFDSKISKGAWKSLQEYCEQLDNPGNPAQNADPTRFGNSQAGFFSNSAFVAEKPQDFRPPMAFVESEEYWTALYQQFITAKNFIDREPCLGKRCLTCGGCETQDQKRFMTSHRLVLPTSANYSANLARLVAAKAAFTPVFAEIKLPYELAFARNAYRESWILRTLCALVPGLERIVFRVAESLYGTNQAFGDIVRQNQGRFGVSIFAFYGPDDATLRKILETVPSIATTAIQSISANGAEARSQKPKGLTIREPMRDFGASIKSLGPFENPREFAQPREIEASIDLPDLPLDLVATRAERFFDSLALNYTKTRMVRGTEAGLHYQFSPSQRGKRLFFDATIQQQLNTVSFDFVAGNKINLGAFLYEIVQTFNVLPAVRVNALGRDNPTKISSNY
ncbi:MAG TPA: radical SAM protein [Spirochaetales bacterium]|nr:radical SAM protein [Spirochaetales bacterium]